MARGDLFYEAWAEYPRAGYYKTDEQRRHCVAARWTREEAEEKLAEYVASQTARGRPPERFWVEERRVETDFEIPPLPAPRDLYTVKAEPLTQPGEWTPAGDFGFVWGCMWGDDAGWKVQYLDLSRINEGVITRDDRFGYIVLVTDPKAHPKNFIELWRWEGRTRVRFKVDLPFDLETGAWDPQEDFEVIHQRGGDFERTVWVNGRRVER